MKKNIIILLLLVLVLQGCSKKNEYYIEPLKSKNIVEVDGLREEYIPLIEDYMPRIIKWYNSINISTSNEIPVDFLPSELEDTAKEIWDLNIDILSHVEGTEIPDYALNDFKASQSIQGIYHRILYITLNSKRSYTIDLNPSNDNSTNNDNNTMNVETDDWVKLGEAIKDAKQFYYNED